MIKILRFRRCNDFLQYRNNKIDILCFAFTVFTNMQYCKIPFYACFFLFFVRFFKFLPLWLDLYQECILYTKYCYVSFAFVKLIA